MSVTKGKLEAVVSLNRSSCYFLKTGTCSLSLIEEHDTSLSPADAPSDLFYCPRLYKAMRLHEKCKPLVIAPCGCGHAEIVSGAQRACIANQKQLEVTARLDNAAPLKRECSLCSGQLRFDTDTGGMRLLSLRTVLRQDQDMDKE